MRPREAVGALPDFSRVIELEPRKDVVASDHLKRKDGGQRCRFSGNDKKDVKPNLVQEKKEMQKLWTLEHTVDNGYAIPFNNALFIR